MTERKHRFQFSLRLMMLAMVIFSASTVLYLKMRRIRVLILTQLQADDLYSRIPCIYETQNPFTIASVRKSHAADEEKRRRFKEADSQVRFRILRDRHEQQKLEYQKRISKLPVQFAKAKRLAEYGDASGISELVSRYSSLTEKDKKRLVYFAELLPAEMICQNESLAQFLKDRISQSNPVSSLQEAEILHNCGIDSKPLIEACKWEIENTAGYPKIRASIRLLEIAPVDDSFQLALSVFEDSNHSYNSYLIGTLLNTDGFAEAADGKFKNRLVSAAIRFADEEPRYDRYLLAMTEHDCPEFLDFCRSTAAKPAVRKRRNYALSKLYKDGKKGESKRLLDSILADETFPGDVMPHYLALAGREAVFAELAKRLQTNKSYPMLVKMCELAEGDDREVAKSICLGLADEMFDETSPYFKKYDLIEYLADFGYQGVDELRKRVPVQKNIWREGQKPAQEFVDWVNRKLNPINPIDESSVFSDDDNSWLADHGNWHPSSFRIKAMEAAGRVVYLDPQEFEIDSVFFTKIASVGGEQFQIEAHSCIDGNVKLLINGRIYSFDVDNVEAWYEVVGACELVNTILERHDIEERYFVFSEAWGNSYMLNALFAKPSVAKEFAERYPSDTFVKGSEVYWKTPQPGTKQ